MQQADESVSVNFNLYQAIVEQAADAIIFADREGAIRAWNRGAEAVFGYAAAEVLGSSLDVIIPGRLRRAHWEGFRRVIDTGQTKHGDRVLSTRSVHKDGSRLYVDLRFGLISNEVGAIIGALTLGRDCTDRHLAGDALRTRTAGSQE